CLTDGIDHAFGTRWHPQMLLDKHLGIPPYPACFSRMIQQPHDFVEGVLRVLEVDCETRLSVNDQVMCRPGVNGGQAWNSGSHRCNEHQPPDVPIRLK